MDVRPPTHNGRRAIRGTCCSGVSGGSETSCVAPSYWTGSRCCRVRECTYAPTFHHDDDCRGQCDEYRLDADYDCRSITVRSGDLSEIQCRTCETSDQYVCDPHATEESCQAVAPSFWTGSSCCNYIGPYPYVDPSVHCYSGYGMSTESCEGVFTPAPNPSGEGTCCGQPRAPQCYSGDFMSAESCEGIFTAAPTNAPTVEQTPKPQTNAPTSDAPTPEPTTFAEQLFLGRFNTRCDQNTNMQTANDCFLAVQSLGFAVKKTKIKSGKHYPPGCSVRTKWDTRVAFFNLKAEGKVRQKFQPVCRATQNSRFVFYLGAFHSDSPVKIL